MVAPYLTPPAAPAPALDLADIQKIVFSGWRHMSHVAYLFARLPDDPARARRWLASLVTHIAPASAPGAELGQGLQLALSASGLAALGLPDKTAQALPQELKEGMASRARILGDLGDSDPDAWPLGGPGQRLDALLMLFAPGHDERAAMVTEHRGALEGHGGRQIGLELSGAWSELEPFGFADGISQPFVAGQPGRPRPGQDTIAPGEILLGYPNAYGHVPTSPRLDGLDLGRNGTYLVFRKLEQDVIRFWRYFTEQAAELELHGDLPTDPATRRDWLAARVMGRWRSGASTVLTPHRDDPAYANPEVLNAFGYYDADRHGQRCPVGSHVRRANPRDARGGSPAESMAVVNRHRILRRGRSYGDDLTPEQAVQLDPEAEAGKRGLYFVCLQANIARGFEFIQQTWLANPGFAGLFDEIDPVAGGPGNGTFTIPSERVRLRLCGMPRFVTTRGGGYFFLPSLTALGALAGA